MSDPERLSRNRGNSLAALLLQAGAEERPSAAVWNRTAAALAATAATTATGAGSVAAAAWGVKHAAGNAASASGLAGGTPALTATSTGLTSATLGIGAVAKWVAIGALGGAVAMSSVQALNSEQGAKRIQAVPAEGMNGPASSRSLRSTGATPAAATPIATVDAKEPEPPNAIGPQRAPSPEPALGEVAKPEAGIVGRSQSAFLAAEVRFVDQGRAALQRGAFADALEQLAPYEELFPHQQLLTEVLFLRMEASGRLGNVERARSLATRVLALGVTGRQAAQARELLGRSQ